MPSPVYPTEVVATYMTNSIEGAQQQQPSIEELTKEIEEAADLLVGGFDRDGDEEIRDAIQQTFFFVSDSGPEPAQVMFGVVRHV